MRLCADMRIQINVVTYLKIGIEPSAAALIQIDRRRDCLVANAPSGICLHSVPRAMHLRGRQRLGRSSQLCHVGN